MDIAGADLQGRRGRWIVALVMVGIYLLLRLPGVGDMPAFTDEATYARWTQLILADPLSNAFISMTDAKFPLHYWLMAMTRWMASDPVVAGRMLSVVLGAVGIFPLMGLARELWRLRGGEQRDGTLFGILACGVVMTCPLVAMLQRMALAESLLILETILIAWLSLRFARLLSESASRRTLLRAAVGLGLAWAMTLVTKQNASYALWILPLAAMLVRVKRETMRLQTKRFIPYYALATVVALAIFVPMLFSDASYPLSVRLFYKPAFQNHSIFSPWVIAKENLVRLVSPRYEQHAQWWPYDAKRPLQEGWLYLYMTPPIFLMAPLALLTAVKARQWRILGFVGVWAGSQLLPLVFAGGLVFSRYFVIGLLPILLLAAWGLAEWLSFAADKMGRWQRASVITVGAMVVLAWPVGAVVWSNSDWRAPTLTQSDYEQFVTRWPGGSASVQTCDWLEEQAGKGPITVITRAGVGLPSEMIDLRLTGNRNIELFAYDSTQPMREIVGRKNTYLLTRQRERTELAGPIRLDMRRPTYLLAAEVWDKDEEKMVDIPKMQDLPEGARQVMAFRNGVVGPLGHHIFEVRVLEVPGDGRAVAAAK